MEKLLLNKNRGWRGLAEAQVIDDAGSTIQKMIFSFSQPVWVDMLKGYFVMQDTDNYIVLQYDRLDKLPSPTQQRSVLIKNITLPIVNKTVYPKNDWMETAMSHGHYNCISNFLTNRNNHTQSDWNCIGIRVVPMI